MTRATPSTPAADPQAALATAWAEIDASEPRVRAWVAIDRDGAGRAAADSAPDAPLRGCTVGVKDVIDVAGLPTRAGSRVRADAPAAERDAVVVARLRAAGALILGKVKTTTFAYLDPADTDNPAAWGHTPGGSSSGSAAAVAAGHVALALGTQTVGSVCRPAAYCGVPAFKPSTGSTPGAGVTPLAPSFDTVGFLARDLRLAVRAWHLSAALPGAGTATPLPVASLVGRRIGLIDDENYAGLSAAARHALARAADRLRAAGAQIVPLATGIDFAHARVMQRAMMQHEAHAAHGHLLAQAERLEPQWRACLEAGRAVDAEAYQTARDALVDARRRLAQALDGVDAALAAPVTDGAPAGLHATGDAGLIAPWTIHGGPLAVLPVQRDPGHGLPMAAMLIGKPWEDLALARLALLAEECLAG